MTTKQALEDIFCEAIELAPADRSAYLNEKCGSSPQIRSEVERMISSVDGFMEEPAIQVAALLAMEELETPAGGVAESDPISGQTIGKYRVGPLIGVGGMGEVYLAQNTILESTVALKRLAPHVRKDIQYRDLFLSEARRAVAINHPNVSRVYDVLDEPDEVLIVMEHVDGHNLRRHMGGDMDIDHFLSIAVQCAEALVAAHNQGIVHLDIKPENIMLTSSGKIKVCDFGLARKILSHTNLQQRPRSVVFGGTPKYMAPEILQSQEWDERSDIFSLGVVFFEALTGTHPFEFRRAVNFGDLPVRAAGNLRQLNPKVPAELEELVESMIRVDPQARCNSATLVLDTLEQLKQVRGNAFVMAFELVSGLVYHYSRNRPVTMAALTLLAIALIGAGVAAFGPAMPYRASAAARQSIVVLPFRAIGGDEKDQVLIEGLTQTLTAKLGALSNGRPIHVIPASFVRERNVNSIEDARSVLGASLVIEGTITFLEGTVRADYVLMDASSRATWKKGTLTLERGDSFGLQDQIVLGVVRALQIAIKLPEDRMLSDHGTRAPNAFDFYTVALGYIEHFDRPGSLDNAIQVLTRALDVDKEFGRAYEGLGEAYIKKSVLFSDLHFVSDAAQACERARELDDRSAGAYICLGMVESARGKNKEALQMFRTALSYDSANGEAYIGVARALEQQGEVEQAESILRKAIDLEPDYWVGYATLAAFYDRQARYPEAAANYRQAVDLAPDSSYARLSLGGAYIHIGRYDEAIEQFQIAVNLRPSFEAYSNWGMAYWYRRDLDRAIPMFEHANGLASDYRTTGNLARAYYNSSNRRSEGLELFRRAAELCEERLKVNPNDSDVHLLLARYYSMLGRRAEAMSHLRVALEARPTNSHYLQFAAVVYNQVGDPANAIASLQKAVVNGLQEWQLRSEMELDNLRPLPMFQNLFKQVRN